METQANAKMMLLPTNCPKCTDPSDVRSQNAVWACILLDPGHAGGRHLGGGSCKSTPFSWLELGPQQQMFFFAWLVENKGNPKNGKKQKGEPILVKF